MRISISNAAGAAIVALLILSACSREQVPEGHAVVGDTPRQESHAVGPPFVDVAAQAGIDFTHWNGMAGEHYFVEPGSISTTTEIWTSTWCRGAS